MAKQRYLKQAGSNYVVIWAKRAAQRKDMIEISEEEALKLLVEQQKTHAQKMADESKVEKPKVEETVEEKLMDEPSIVIDDLKKGQELPEEAAANKEPKPVKEDADIKMLKEIRIVGKGKAKIELWMLEKYGINVDRRFKLDQLVDQAIAKRKEELGI